jgi:hypothetical protein
MNDQCRARLTALDAAVPATFDLETHSVHLLFSLSPTLVYVRLVSLDSLRVDRQHVFRSHTGFSYAFTFRLSYPTSVRLAFFCHLTTASLQSSESNYSARSLFHSFLRFHSLSHSLFKQTHLVSSHVSTHLFTPSTLVTRSDRMCFQLFPPGFNIISGFAFSASYLNVKANKHARHLKHKQNTLESDGLGFLWIYLSSFTFAQLIHKSAVTSNLASSSSSSSSSSSGGLFLAHTLFGFCPS